MLVYKIKLTICLHKVRSGLLFRFGVAIPFCNLAKTPTVRGPFEENVSPNRLLTYCVKAYEHANGWICRLIGIQVETGSVRIHHCCRRTLRLSHLRTAPQQLVAT